MKRVEILSANKLFTARVHDMNIGSSLLSRIVIVKCSYLCVAVFISVYLFACSDHCAGGHHVIPVITVSALAHCHRPTESSLGELTATLRSPPVAPVPGLRSPTQSIAVFHFNTHRG